MSESASAPARSSLAHAFRSLGLRDYRNYWLSGLGMTGAQGFTQFGLAWLILDLTDRVGQLGVVIFMQGLAWTTVALVGGLLADRYSRRTLLIGSQSLTIVSLATIAILTMQGQVQVWQVYAAAFILGTNQALSMPARTAILRNLVSNEYMLNAVALNSMQQHSARILWPTLAGLIIGIFSVGIALLTGAVCSAVSVAFLLLIRNLKEEARPPRTSPIKEVVEGVRYSFSTPVVKMVMLLNFSVAFFGLAFLHMQPGFAREVLDFSAGKTGLFLMAGGVGAVLGSVGLVFVDVRDKNTIVSLGMGGFALALLALCINPWVPAAFLFMALWGFSNAVFAVLAQTIFPTVSDPRYLGRVLGLWSLGGGISAITALPIGLAGDEFGLRWSLGIVAALLVLCTVYIMAVHLPKAQRATAALARS